MNAHCHHFPTLRLSSLRNICKRLELRQAKTPSVSASLRHQSVKESTREAFLRRRKRAKLQRLEENVAPGATPRSARGSSRRVITSCVSLALAVRGTRRRMAARSVAAKSSTTTPYLCDHWWGHMRPEQPVFPPCRHRALVLHR